MNAAQRRPAAANASTIAALPPPIEYTASIPGSAASAAPTSAPVSRSIPRPSLISVIRSAGAAARSTRFQGEEEREIGFRRVLRAAAPELRIIAISEGRGIDRETGALVRAALAADPGIDAVYSIGGGNAAIVEAFAAAGRRCAAFIGHDLDSDNLRLLRAGRIGAVLHHDLRQDMRLACRHIMHAHGALPAAAVGASLASVQVVTPFNLPAGI